MKYVSLYFPKLLILFFIAVGHVPHNLSAVSLFHENGVLTSSVKKTFEYLQVPITTLKEAEDFAQKNLLRTGERWDTQAQTPLHTILLEKKQELLSMLRDLGMINAIAPTQKSYVYALLMGGLKERVIVRLAHLAELERQGYSFQELYILGGERPLRNEEKEGLPVAVSTETHLMKYLCEKHPQFQDRKVLSVDAPMVEKKDGTMARPTTDDTFVHFARIAPQYGACLVVSNNPYIGRQTKVAQRILDQSRFPTQGTGDEVKEKDMDIVMLMDEFARTLHEEYLAFIKSKAA